MARLINSHKKHIYKPSSEIYRLKLLSQYLKTVCLLGLNLWRRKEIGITGILSAKNSETLMYLWPLN